MKYSKGSAALAAVSLLSVLALVAGLVALSRPVRETVVGAVPGLDHTEREFFKSGIEFKTSSYGNSGLATTTNGTGAFTAAQLCTYDRIVATPNVGSVTLSVASSSDMFSVCLPNPGDVREVFFRNASTTGTAAITLADAGVNTEHVEEEGATTVIDVAEFGKFIFRNLDDTTMIFEVEVLQAAD
jgi:hypothetical protein